MDAMDSGDEPDDEPMSKDMLEDIRGRIQYHPNVNRRESRYKIRDRNKPRQSEWKCALKATQNMGKGLQNIYWCEVGLQFSDIATKNVGENDINPGMKYIMVILDN